MFENKSCEKIIFLYFILRIFNPINVKKCIKLLYLDLFTEPVTGPIIVRGGNKKISRKFHAGR